MKIKVLPTGNSPDYYRFVGETLTVFKDGESESFDLSVIQTGDQFQGLEPEVIDLNSAHIMRNVYRDSQGNLHVDICQSVGPGHWEVSDEFLSSSYNPEQVYVNYREDKPHSGKAWVLTKSGKVYV